MLASLNGLSVLSANVQNAYLNAPTKEKCYCIAGPEFGQDKVGRLVLIIRALYDQKVQVQGGKIILLRLFVPWVSTHVLQTRMYGCDLRYNLTALSTGNLYWFMSMIYSRYRIILGS
jgi:hypothetical protein